MTKLQSELDELAFERYLIDTFVDLINLDMAAEVVQSSVHGYDRKTGDDQLTMDSLELGGRVAFDFYND